jgi:hypothetical protein
VTTQPQVFPADALEANRRGELTDTQRQRFQGLSRYRRKDQLRAAALLAAGGMLIMFLASPSTSHAAHVFVPLGCFVLATVLVVRSLTGGDALTRDLRRGRVRCVEGAIGKSRGVSIDDSADNDYFLDVGASRFGVAPMTFSAAPDAGYVRLYFLPLSRKVVNLERLPDAPVDASLGVREMLPTLGAAILSPSIQHRNEARARIAGIGNAMQAAFAPVAPPSREACDPRPLAEAILGTWSNGLLTVTFCADGSVTAQGVGRGGRGRWSVDSEGQLHAELDGRTLTARAWVTGDSLVVAAEGRSFALSRRVQ